MLASVLFSPCQRYRYELRRVWEPGRPLVLFIGLNPSATPADADNPTSRVCMNYARRWGYGGMVLANLFAWRSTDPAVLPNVADPVGPDNDAVLCRLQDEAALTVCAWTDAGALHRRDEAVLAFLRDPHCLARLRSGRPGHPLYKRADLTPFPL